MDVPFEPSADSRIAAKSLRQYYVALTHEGFTSEQAMQIICTILSALVKGQKE